MFGGARGWGRGVGEGGKVEIVVKIVVEGWT